MLSYYAIGKGKVVVLLHGFCEDHTLWKDYADKLSDTYYVIVPELPGFGQSSPEFGEAVSIEYYARRVHELLEQLVHTEERVTFIGHSLGGYVALAFADFYPERINGFGLFHSTAFPDSEEKKQNRDKVAQYIQDKGVPAFTDNFVEPLFYVGNRQRFQAEINVVKQQARLTSREGAVAATLAMKERSDRTSVLKETKVPVLFIAGKKDTSVPIEKSLEQCHLPEKSLVYFLDNVGHMGMIEAKEECFVVVKSFIELCKEVNCKH
ncbi:MAG TPA: alpha/beta hydrolase [Cytophagaceae bacterium]|jgi:pimeloyl-ACP methyl ester carboxylesterase|nr:alpha/beta hydrolase [Cytophagaceae bacterium]